MVKLRKNNIVLIGYMGSGKSTVGALLAKMLNFEFYDTDVMIERREQQTIDQLFESKGEEHFRELETMLIRELISSLDTSVLSTGGGMPLREQNRKLLSELGFVVYLKTSVQASVKRLRYDQTRPLLKGENLEDRVGQMLELRAPIYEATADMRIVTDLIRPKEIAEIIIKEYKKWQIS